MAQPSYGKMALIIVATAVPAALLLCGGFIALVVAGGDTEVQPGDRGLLLTADDVVGQFPEFEPIPARESMSRRGLFGATELEYTYEYEDGDDPLVYIYSQASLETDASSATSTYGFVKAGARIGLGVEDAQFEEKDFFSWGQESEFLALLGPDGTIAGGMFIGRDGRRVWLATWAGIIVDDRETARALLEPSLQRFERYDP